MLAAAQANSVPPPRRRWTPYLMVRVGMLLHVGGLIALVLEPARWPWVIGMLAVFHGLMSLSVLWPRGSLLGANLTRLPAAAVQRREVNLSFDDGPHPEFTPRVLDLLDRYQVRASFFCIGENAAAHPELVREIVRRGHSVENHSQSHRHHFAFRGFGGLRYEIDAAQETIAGITGIAPLFFRAPAGFRNPFLDPLLAWRGLTYVSWTRRGFDATDADAERVLARLTRGLAAGDILLMHDGADVVLSVLPRLLDALAQAGLKPVTLPAACGHA